jgi:transketolase
LHDLAALRAIHNLTLIVPADNFETREAIRAAAKSDHPFFIRFGKAALYGLHQPDAKFEVGKASTLHEGNDVAFIGTGETVVHCLLAAAHLAERGLNCRVPFHIVGIPDEDTVTGAQADIFRHYGLSMEGLAKTALKLVKKT